MRICIFGSASDDIDSAYIEAGEKLGEMLGKRGHSLIFGAGNSGMMGAVARGFYRAGAEIVGVVPSFFPDGVLFPNCTELVKTETMRERKAIMEERADAFITTVGGIGTFEEFFEVLTLKQLARHAKAVTILNTNGYYDNMLKMLDTAVDGEFLTKQGRGLCADFSNSDDLVKYLDEYTEEIMDIFKLRKLGK